MRLRYSLRAQADLEAIFAYLDERPPGRARAVRTEIRLRIEQRREFPMMAPATEIAGIRELSVIRYPYKIYYEIRGDELHVLHIRHTSRRPWTGDRR